MRRQQEGLLNEKTSKMNNSGKPVASLKRKWRDLFKYHKWKDIILGKNSQDKNSQTISFRTVNSALTSQGESDDIENGHFTLSVEKISYLKTAKKARRQQICWRQKIKQWTFRTKIRLLNNHLHWMLHRKQKDAVWDMNRRSS